MEPQRVMLRPGIARWIPFAALAALMSLGCDTAPAEGDRPKDGPATQAPAAQVELVEASGIAVRGGGTVAIVGGDETSDRLWAVSLDHPDAGWELLFPRGTPTLDDVEDLAAWGEHGVLVTCSQSRTKPREKSRPERDRLALVTLSPDARQVADVRVYDGLRDRLLQHLAASGDDLFAEPAAIAANGPNRGGLNVEGLAAWKGQLLIGLRSPTAKGGAVVIPMNEPGRLFQGGPPAGPDFGKPIVLPTKPREGIRGMAPAPDGVLVLLGDQADAKDTAFRLVRWDPEKNTVQELQVPGFRDIANPEGIALDPQGRLLVVQDDKQPKPGKVLFRLELAPAK